MLILFRMDRKEKLYLKNKYEVCDKCRANHLETLLPKIQKLDPEAEIVTRCIGFCGIGREKIVVLKNHIPVIGATEEEVLEALKEKS